MWKFLLGLFLGFIIGAIGLMFLVEKNGNEVNFFYKQGFKHDKELYEVTGTLKPLDYTTDDKFEYVKITCNTKLKECFLRSTILTREGVLFEAEKYYTIEHILGSVMVSTNSDDACLDKIIEINVNDGSTLLKTVKSNTTEFCKGHTPLKTAKLGEYIPQGRVWVEK